MKHQIKTLLLSGCLALATTVAFAQTPGASTPMRTGAGGPNSINNDSNDTSMNKGMNNKGSRMNAGENTTGSGMKSPAAQSNEKAVSPASTDAGIKQEK
jgi:hypothetical protein